MEDETFLEEDSHFSIDIGEQKYLKNISFSGGGFKGLAFLGCVKALQERDVLHNVKSYAGSSVGALIAYELSEALLRRSTVFDANFFTFMQFAQTPSSLVEKTEV